MKKMLAALIAAMLMLMSLTGCAAEPAAEAPDARVPSFLYEGVIYCTTGEAVPAEVVEEAYLGYIESEVPLSQWPQEEKQANFSCEGQPFALCGGDMLLKIETEWVRFEPREISE